MLQFFKDLYYSFPIQLLLLSFKRHQFFLFFWIFLLVIIIGKFAGDIGVPYLFLDPEYLGHVGYLSFSLVGVAFGAMYVIWNIVMYMLNSHRYPFMASLQYPLVMFFINNSLVPLFFVIAYFWAIISFQTRSEFESWWQILFEIVGFLAGFLLSLLVTGVYFEIANRSAGSIIHDNKSNLRRKRVKRLRFDEIEEAQKLNRVDFYLSNKLHLRHTRTVEKYDPRLHQMVFRRHHINAFIAQFVTLLLLVATGFFIENQYFQVPTAATAFFFVGVVMSLFGLFIYWTGGWGSTAIIVFLIIANLVSKYDLLGYKTMAYGLNYKTGKAQYSVDNLRKLSSDDSIAADKIHFLKILEKWKAKNQRTPTEKPKLVFINVSGGGMRSAMFSMRILQIADSVAGGKLFDKTFLISGASGGMFSTTYLRELFLRKKQGEDIDLSSLQYTEKVSRDVLNPMTISILTNDIFLPYHRFEVKGNKYWKDRGYVFERFFCKNTGLDFEKPISAYRKAEADATIPLLIYHTAIMNDSRRYYISPQPVSFLMRPHGKNAITNQYEIDGVDFGRFFVNQNADSLLVTSALRMNATFPFIFPNPVLPSEPATYVMDGGALDNFGSEITFKFLQTFKDWIDKNVSEVIVIQIRDSEKIDVPETEEAQTILGRLFSPLGTVYNNMENMQDFFLDQKMDYIDEELKGKVKFVLFEYRAEKPEDKAAMSLHLSARDKYDILKSTTRPNNRDAFTKLARLLQ
jgi:hypothetical protein